VCYEDGKTNAARAFLSSWLTTYPRNGFFSWPSELASGPREIEAGNGGGSVTTYNDAIALTGTAGRQQKVTDGLGFYGARSFSGQPA